jgi:hypothetical protein
MRQFNPKETNLRCYVHTNLIKNLHEIVELEVN